MSTKAQASMKRILSVAACIALLGFHAFGQGMFVFANGGAGGALTRIGSIDGPLAGSAFWAQMLAGETANSLTPVGVSRPHSDGEFAGAVAPSLVEVPGSPPFTTVYMQMLAWDSRLWGTSLANVPLEWLGRTDIVTVELRPSTGIPPPPPIIPPRFTQPAVVPIPEPSILALTALGGFFLLLRLRAQP